MSKMFGRVLSEEESEAVRIELYGAAEDRLAWIHDYASKIAMGDLPEPEDKEGFRRIARIAFMPGV